jgi:phosphoglycerate dehydrogenase-like enzyme
LLNHEAFSRFKPTAYLINAARGPIVEEAALIDALKTGKIRGAAIDVFEFEPTISSEMAAIENLIITPHVGASVLEAKLNMVHEALMGAYDVLEGLKPENLVNTELCERIPLRGK